MKAVDKVSGQMFDFKILWKSPRASKKRAPRTRPAESAWFVGLLGLLVAALSLTK